MVLKCCGRGLGGSAEGLGRETQEFRVCVCLKYLLPVNEVGQTDEITGVVKAPECCHV